MMCVHRVLWSVAVLLILVGWHSRPVCAQDQLPPPPAPRSDTSYDAVERSDTSYEAVELSDKTYDAVELYDTTYDTVEYDIALLGLDGVSRSLSDFRDRVLFINFWATWCRPCVAELPSIEALGKRLEGASVEVLMISVDDDTAVVRQFLREREIDGQVYLRGWDAGESSFRRAVVPTTYVVSKSGRLVYRHSGAADWDSARFASFLRRLAEE